MRLGEPRLPLPFRFILLWCWFHLIQLRATITVVAILVAMVVVTVVMVAMTIAVTIAMAIVLAFVATVASVLRVAVRHVNPNVHIPVTLKVGFVIFWDCPLVVP